MNGSRSSMDAAVEGRVCRRLTVTCLLIGLFVMGCSKHEIVYRPTQQIVPNYSYPEAKKTISRLWQQYGSKPGKAFSNNLQKPRVKFGRDSIELSATDSKNGCISVWKWNFSSASDPYVDEYTPPLPPVMVIIAARMDRGSSSKIGCNPPYHSNGHLYFDTVSDAKDFVNAYYVLKHGGEAAERAAEAEFAGKAKRYREMPVRPALPEDVQKCRIMAEDAINSKEFEKAAEYYEQGLEIEPLWPEGQFNAALLYGELKDYENAALHMKRYLELVPNARDAKEAREKMYLWEGKAREARTN